MEAGGSCQKLGELMPLMEFLQDKNIRSIVEIGVSAGGTTSVFKYCFPEAVVVGVDWQSSDLIKESQKRQPFLFVAGDSREQSTIDKVLKLLPKKYIDFLFIDGSHLYEDVKRDFELWYPHSRIVALHDIIHNLANVQDEVYMLWRRLKKKHQTIEFIEQTGWGGIGVINE